MAPPVRNSISDFVYQLITDEAFGTEIQDLVANVLHGTDSVNNLRERVAIDPSELRAMSPPPGGRYGPTMTTKVTTVRCRSAAAPDPAVTPESRPPTVTTVTILPFLAVDPDGSVE